MSLPGSKTGDKTMLLTRVSLLLLACENQLVTGLPKLHEICVSLCVSMRLHINVI